MDARPGSAVFQVPLPGGNGDERKALTATLRGQQVFAADALYEVLLQRYFEGWRFQKTRLTEEFDFQRYREKTADAQFATIIVRSSGGLVLNLARYKPVSGDTVINFLPAEK